MRKMNIKYSEQSAYSTFKISIKLEYNWIISLVNWRRLFSFSIFDISSHYMYCVSQLHITATYITFKREHTGEDLNDRKISSCFKHQTRYIKLKFTSNQYRPFTVMYRISFERHCRKRITATYKIFNKEHAPKTPVNNRWVFSQPMNTDESYRSDGQTEFKNTFQLSLESVKNNNNRLLIFYEFNFNKTFADWFCIL
jgi:hypothetical protein